MKKFLKKRFLGIPLLVSLVLVVVLLTGGVVFATTWQTNHLYATGSVIITEPSPTYTYTLSDNHIIFGTTSKEQGSGAFTVNATPITITNTGNQAISGLNLVRTDSIVLPSGWSITSNVASIVPIAPNTSATIQFTLSCTATTVGTTDLSGLIFDLTPQ